MNMRTNRRCSGYANGTRLNGPEITLLGTKFSSRGCEEQKAPAVFLTTINC